MNEVIFMEFRDFIKKFADQLEVDNVQLLTEETLFRSLDEWSSLSILELIVLYDEEFDKQIGDADISRCTTLMDLYKLAIE